MNTFTNIYNKDFANFLMLYEIDKTYIDDNTISYRIELEFNEEREIEIEQHLTADKSIDIFDIFYQIVCDAQNFHCNKNYDSFEDYVECRLGAMKLYFLVGDENYNNLVNCQMDYKV